MSIATRLSRLRLGAVDAVGSATSPLLASDNAPVGSQYFGTTGIPWTKSGDTETAWVAKLLRAPYLNVKSFGATGNGTTDDRPAIQAAINAAIALGGATVFFPPGTYRCQLTGGGVAGIPTFLLTGEAQGNLLFLGSGRSSLITMYITTAAGDRRLFDIKNGCKYVGFKNLAFLSEIAEAVETEQQHLIHFECAAASSDLETGRSFITDCYFGHTRGDCIRFLGSDTRRVANIKVTRCVAQGARPLARTFLQFQRSSDDVTVDACFNEDVSACDYEPTGTGGNAQSRFSRNHFTGNMAISGNSAIQETIRTIVTNNCFSDSSVGGINCGDLVLAGNIVRFNTAGVTNGAVSFSEHAHNHVVCDNIIYRGLLANADSTVLNYENHGQAGDNNNLNISGNICMQEGVPTTGCHAISLRDVTKAVCTNNMLLANDSVLASANCIRLESITETAASVDISCNLGLSLNLRVSAGLSANGSGLAAVGNLFRQCNTGINWAPIPTSSPCIASHNVLISQTASVSVIGGATAAACGGIGTNTGPTILTCIGAPEGVAATVAEVGSLALRTTPGGAGLTLYVKESGSGSNTGWIGK